MAMETETQEQEAPAPPLSALHVNRSLTATNRLLATAHAALAAAAIAHRSLSSRSASSAAMVAADLTLLFLWALSQSGMWRPVSRLAFPDRLLASRRRSALPAIDVLVVTADPEKEPPLGVMNTVLSAMALDYPGGRLSVYLSDDAGSPLTLLAARKAYAFARAWVPFCRKYSVLCPCPDRYFAGDDQDGCGGDHHRDLADDRLRIKKMYEALKEEVEEAKDISGRRTKAAQQEHDAYVEIISDSDDAGSTGDGDEETKMPVLVYVSREKRRASPHHFKAGALNVLLRVSSLVSKSPSPYVLVLDCDMSCNSRSSALEAMCFHLDHRRPPAPENLAFVQFPQRFHNISDNDIYTNELRYIFSVQYIYTSSSSPATHPSIYMQTRWFGQDGLRGPVLSGTGFFARRDALYGATPGETTRRPGDDHVMAPPPTDTDTAAALRLVSSCAYETGTAWGEQVGFLYQSVVEDYFTGYRQLFCRGWTSAYWYPPPPARPAFLGSMPTNLNDVLVQNKRWMSGMLAVGLSKQYCPLTCRPLLAISVLQAMTIAYFGFAALYAFPVLCYATLPQLCFFRGAGAGAGAASSSSLFPSWSWSWSWSWLFAAAFASSLLQHLVEVSVAKRRLDVRTWWNEQRFWMLNAVTGQLFACVSVFLSLTGAGGGQLDFDLTSKAADGGGDRLYKRGVFDFTGCSTLLLPATTLCVLNAAALLGGTCRMLLGSGFVFSGELFLLCYVAALSYPLLEGMFLRQDPARVPPRITALSVAFAALLLALFG